MSNILTEGGSIWDIKTITYDASVHSQEFSAMTTIHQQSMQVSSNYFSQRSVNNSMMYESYTVSSVFPYVVSRKIEEEQDRLWFDYYCGINIYYATRLEAEKNSIALMIEFHKKQLQTFKSVSSIHKKKKNIFNGYYRPNKIKYFETKKLIETLQYALKNIEEEHPEWLI